MITPANDDVHLSFEPFFFRNFLVMMDEYTGISEIIEQCISRSTTAGDTMNRWCDRFTALRDIRGIVEAEFNGKHH